MDAPQWRAMERFTNTFSIGSNLPTTAARVDRARSFHGSLVSARRVSGRIGLHRLGTPDRRWNLLSCEKRGDLVGVGRKGKGTTVLVLMDNDRTPLSAVIAPANDHEVRHIERLLDAAVVSLPDPARLIYDGAADSDPLRARLKTRGIELIGPHRANRVRPRTQDGRKLRRHRHRWKIERTNAWLQDLGRIANRKDRLAIRFLGWVQLACLFTILKRF